MKTYIVKIIAEGITHHQLIADEDDLKVLLTVLKKVEKDAHKSVNELKQSDVNSNEGQSIPEIEKMPEVTVCVCTEKRGADRVDGWFVCEVCNGRISKAN